MAEQFRRAVESGDAEQLLAALHPDVVFRSPAVYRPYHGRDTAAPILTAVTKVFEDFRYVAEFSSDDGAVLMFEARVGGKELEGVDIVRLDSEGVITELTVMIRPMSALIAVAEAVGAAIA